MITLPWLEKSESCLSKVYTKCMFGANVHFDPQIKMSCFLSYLENCGYSRGLTQLVRLIECTDPIENHLSSVHLSHEMLTEYELILARAGFFTSTTTNVQEFLICPKHRLGLGRLWRSKTTCQYPKHKGTKTAVKWRDVCNMAMSKVLHQAYGVIVPVGSGTI